MTTEQTAQQLELAAQILRTGHPWEYRVTKVDGEEWHDGKISDVSYYAHYSKIRLVLATPPDNRPLHNPRGLTAEEVGAGYRLLVAEDEFNPDADVFWDGTWRKTASSRFYTHIENYRLPISAPWPEPAFQNVPQSSTFFLPGTVIRFPDATDLWGAVTAINQDGLVVGDTYQSYQEIATSKAMANRSIPLTGKWNPDAWEPCSKTIPADENLAEPKSK